MYKTYLEESDLREEEHFPMIALLNEAASEDLLDFLGNLCKGIGSGYDYSNCYFGDELDDYERSQMQKFDGICVETEDGESVLLRFTDAYKYMELLLEILS